MKTELLQQQYKLIQELFRAKNMRYSCSTLGQLIEEHCKAMEEYDKATENLKDVEKKIYQRLDEVLDLLNELSNQSNNIQFEEN